MHEHLRQSACIIMMAEAMHRLAWYRSVVVLQCCSGAVAQWCSGAVVQWCSGAVVQWCSGAVLQYTI